MICCYLLYSNQQQTAEDALAYYDEKRTKDRKGVTIPSQRRYVQYFAKLLRSNLRYERRYLEFFEIRFTEAQLLYSQGTVHCAISGLQDTCGCLKVQPLQNLNIDFRKSFTLDMKNFALRVSGDIKVELSHKTSKKRILHFWFNTYFVSDAAEMEGEGENSKLVYTLNKCEIDDAHKDKEHKMFTEDFKVQLAFYNESPSNELNRPLDNHRSAQHSYVPPTTRAISNAVAGSSILTSNNSSSCDIQFICDQQTATTTTINTPKLLYNATTIVSAPVTATNNYENVEAKPYGNLNDMTSSNSEQRRPTSLINYNSPHKYIQHMQQQRRSENILQQQQQQQSQQQHPFEQLSSYSTQGKKQQQPQQQPHINMHKNSQQKMMIMHDNHNQTNIQNNCHSIHSQSNISNSSNSSINSHITSVSSSTSMASGGGGGIGVGVTREERDKALNREQQNVEEDEDDADDVDDDDEEEAEEDWESGESAVVKPLPSTTTTTTCTTINTTNNKNAITIMSNSKKLVITTTITTTIKPTTTTTTTNITTLKNTTSTSPSSSASYNTIHEAKNKQQTKHCYLHQMQSSSCYAKKIGDIVHKDNAKHKHYYDDDENVDDKHVDDDVDNNVNDVGDIVDHNVVGININNHHINNIDDKNNYDVDDDDDAAYKAINYHLNAVHINHNKRNVATNANNNDDVDDDDDGQSAANENNTRAIAKRSTRSNKLLMSNLAARYKFMHLLSAKAPKHSYFKRKSLKIKSAEATTTSAGACSNNDCYMLAGAVGGCMENARDMIDGPELEQLRTRTTSVGNAGGCGGGVAGSFGVKASKLKLKMSFSKTNSKLKWTQKFHWLQSYVRSADVAVDLRKSCAQSTSSQRLNSQSSNGNGNSNTNINYNNLNGIKTTTTTTTMECKEKTISTSSLLHMPQNASVGNNSLDDYYSSICDNQLSFNNSPCKSPPFIRNGNNCVDVVDAAQLPGHMSNNNDNKVIVIAARPANIQAIGFNVMCKTPVSTTILTATTNNGSSSNGSSGYATASTLYSTASIYDTPLTSFNAESDDSKISPFVFPSISAEITQLADRMGNRTQTTNTITQSSHAALGNGNLIKSHQHHDEAAVDNTKDAVA